MARVALVTGGTRGIGAAICLALKAQGRTVLANYASNDEAAAAFEKEHGIPSTSSMFPASRIARPALRRSPRIMARSKCW